MRRSSSALMPSRVQERGEVRRGGVGVEQEQDAPALVPVVGEQLDLALGQIVAAARRSMSTLASAGTASTLSRLSLGGGEVLALEKGAESLERLALADGFGSPWPCT